VFCGQWMSTGVYVRIARDLLDTSRAQQYCVS
jgi:hypothetical protein